MSDTPTYGWAWLDGQDEDNPEDAWIMVTTLSEPDANGIQYADGEEIATIMCRNYERTLREHPEWIEAKERDAQMIVNALNATPAVYVAVWGGGYEQPSYRRCWTEAEAVAQARVWSEDANEETDTIQVVAFDDKGDRIVWDWYEVREGVADA